MSGAMSNVSSDGNHTNDNNTTTSSSSLSDGAAPVAVAYPWVRCVYSTVPKRIRHDNEQYIFSSPSPFVPVLGDWVPVGGRHIFSFSLPFLSLSHFNSTPCMYLIRPFVYVAVVVMRNCHWVIELVPSLSLFCLYVCVCVCVCVFVSLRKVFAPLKGEVN